jgi:hypothetical protein
MPSAEAESCPQHTHAGTTMPAQKIQKLLAEAKKQGLYSCLTLDTPKERPQQKFQRACSHINSCDIWTPPRASVTTWQKPSGDTVTVSLTSSY